MSAMLDAPMSREMRRRRELQRSAADPLLTRHEVEAETGLSRSSIYRGMTANLFPKGLLLSGTARRWPLSKIVAWKDRQPADDRMIGIAELQSRTGWAVDEIDRRIAAGSLVEPQAIGRHRARLWRLSAVARFLGNTSKN